MRWLIAALVVVTAFIAAPSIASADSGTGTATLTTDQLSYSPGGVVALSGAGFAAGGTVTVTLSDSLTGMTYGSAAAVVSSDGSFAEASVVLPASFMSTLVATATDASGDTASAPVTETLSPPTFTPTISTDQQDYAPGSVVTITGSGWPAGDSVSVFTDDSDNNTWSNTDQVTADSSGDFTDKVTLPQMFVANYKVAASDASGLTTTTTFTDSNPQAITLATPTSVTVTQGGTASFGNVTVTKGGNTTTCTITLSASSLPAGATATFGTNPLTMTTADVSSTLKVSTTSSTPAGTYTFTVTAARGSNCQGNGDLTSSTLTLVVNSACTAPSVTTQPNAQSITYGTGASFTSAASGSPAPSAQWQVDSGTGFTNLSGATSATLSLTKPAVSQSGNHYRAVFTNSCGSATSNGATLTVAKKGLTVDGASANNKQYDGNDSATVDFTGASLNGVIGLDAVSIDSSGYSAHFNNKNVGNGKPVTVTGVALQGGDAGNYTVSQPSGLTANITKAPLDIYAASDSKTYDGGTSSNKTPTLGANQLQGTDSVDGLTQAFASKNVLGAGNSELDVTGYSIHDGNSGGNYDVHTHTASGNISPATLTVTGITANNKVWDGTKNATLNTSGATLVGVIGTDNVTLNTSGATGTFAQSAVGTWTVSVAGLTLGGGDSGNYNLSFPSTTASIIAWNAAGKGFYAPVGADAAHSLFTPAPGPTPTNLPAGMVWNVAKGGQTIPLKFNIFAGTVEMT
ncbi:MAG TPA: YDG domain-containing protein, partial [Solirubrobacter sp.]